MSMTFGSLLFLAIGLAMDAASVAAVRGMSVKQILPRHIILIALFFGGAQALMPLIGWLIGTQVGPWVQRWDHWIAFGLLCAIGVKMLWDARSRDEDEEPVEKERSIESAFRLRTLAILALATSIDALAVGITLPMLEAPLVLAIATIGITTALVSVLGLLGGRRFGALLGGRLDIVGGLVLIGLGTKTLVEHLSTH